MGCTVKEKIIHTNRRTPSAKPEPDYYSTISPNSDVEKLGNAKLGIRPSGLTRNPNSGFDDKGWGYCSEDHLEEILLKNLEFLYNEALNKLVALGYDDDVALKALLSNGYCYGGMDVLTNVLHNSLSYLTNGVSNEAGFTDLRHLEEYSLAWMVCLLQQVKPHLSKGDALWCLLMSDLHIGHASAMEIPILPPPGRDGGGNERASVGLMSVGPIVVAPELCRFHGGWGFGNNGMGEFPVSGMALRREIECPKRFDLSPSLKSLLKRNVAMFAAGFRANSKLFHSQSRACPSGNSSHDESHDVVNSVTGKLRDLNLDERKNETISNLARQMKDLEKQVKERKEWAHQKAIQAARKVSRDLTELKTLRMERDEIHKGKQTLNKSTFDRLADVEGPLRDARGKIERANFAVRKLEIENAEIRAEMQAAKLSASESVSSCLEVAKREKKWLKKLLAWEKKKAKMEEDIGEERRKVVEVEEALARVEVEIKEAEEKRTHEHKSKELILTHLDEERCLKETSEANTKRKLDSLCHKDDFQRLGQEHTCLKESANYSEIERPYNDIWTDNTKGIINPTSVQ